jgi:trimethylamine--corrinoid protein Co-methyltransferase
MGIYDRFQPLKKADLETIHAHSLDILAHTGMWFEPGEAGELFKKHGFRTEAGRVFFTETQVTNALKTPPAQFNVIAPDAAKNIHVGGDSMLYASSCSATRILDLDGRVRPAKRLDYINALKIIETLDTINFLFEYVVAEDLPPASYLLWNLFAQMQTVSKPLSCQTVDGLGLLSIFYDTASEKMRESAGNGLAYGITFINPLSPLGMSAHESRKLIHCCQSGIAVALAPMGLCGLTAPCTLEGLLVQQNTEILAALTLSQLVAPGAPVLYGCMGTITNMQNMMALVGAAEARIIEHAAAQMARYYGIPSRAIAGMTDSNGLDYQAGAESMLHYVQLARSGVNVMTGLGGFANWMVASLEKLLLDAESAAYVKRLLRPLNFTAERAAVDVIQSVGPRGSYITEDHTLAHFRDEFYTARVFDRQPYDEVNYERLSCRDKANKRVREILDNFQQKPLEKSLDKRLRDYCAGYGLSDYIKNAFDTLDEGNQSP